ncbi:MAG: UbiD family decarboxylase, partial [Deltaproteobacteria bacterium]|nr:UbiD family decarboxylase [Deltaproteobacteria bacterium]
MAQDLRSYLDLVKRKMAEEFVVISKEVDPAYEITAIAAKVEREIKRRPILFFKKVKGSKFPVLTNLHAGRGRLALAMNVAPEAMQAGYLKAMEKPLKPKVVAKGPVKEVVLKESRINLYDL